MLKNSLENILFTDLKVVNMIRKKQLKIIIEVVIIINNKNNA